jgi:predicted transcriptional regulator
MVVAQLWRELRTSACLTQTEAAEVLGLTQAAIKAIVFLQQFHAQRRSRGIRSHRNLLPVSIQKSVTIF